MLVIDNSTDKSIMCDSFDPSNVTGDNTSISDRRTNEKSTSSIDEVQTMKDGLTQAEIDELFEEPLNTENSLEAVMGYVPQDDKRICKFYDAKTGACFKGPNCRLEHTTILKDGWTKDKALMKVKIHSDVPMPHIGKKINLLVTYVVDVERFYGQIIPNKCKSTKDLTAEQIINEINDEPTKLKSLTKAPAEFELVFAMYTDEVWYRAKITEKISDVLYQVFYVDYGNSSTVTLKNLRKWDDAFDHYPFQALECRLDNVSKLKDNHKEATAYFETLVLHQPVKATVTFNFNLLHVTLQGESQYDIGEQLCISNYAQRKPKIEMVTGLFPG